MNSARRGSLSALEHVRRGVVAVALTCLTSLASASASPRVIEIDVSNRSFYTKVQPTTDAPPADLTFKALAPGRYRLQIKRTGFRSNDAYTAYLEMDSPKELNAEQLKQLNVSTSDEPETDRELTIGRDGVFQVRVPMRKNDVVLVTLRAEKKEGQ